MSILGLIHRQPFQWAYQNLSIVRNKSVYSIELILRVMMTVQGVIGFGLGICLYEVIRPLTEKSIRWLGYDIDKNVYTKHLFFTILIAPLAVVIAPAMEEVFYRHQLFEGIKVKLWNQLISVGCQSTLALLVSQIGTLVLTSLIFGVAHFSNALLFLSNPANCLPQVIAASFMGFPLGIAKGVSGLRMAIGMHAGYNSTSLALNIKKMIIAKKRGSAIIEPAINSRLLT